jgi:lipid A 4'-phosphatase
LTAAGKTGLSDIGRRSVRFSGAAGFVTDRMDKNVGPDARSGSMFGLWADPVLALALLGLWIALAIVFHGEPDIDRSIAALFFSVVPCAEGSPQLACGSFPAAASPFWGTIRQALHYLPMAVAIVVLAALAKEIADGRGFKHARTRFAATALAAFALGPGLLVNGFLKDQWGRPRPVMTDLFGGKLPFVPAGEWSNACLNNCSFVSGESASIFWLVCLVPLLPAGQRRIGAVVLTTVAVFTAGLRMAFGGHYLSDVVLGGLSTLIIFAVLATLVEWRARRAASRHKA